MQLVTPGARQYILDLISRGDICRVDALSRRIAYNQYVEQVASMSAWELVELVDKVTGGLGYKRDKPFNSVSMTLAGTVIVWPDAVEKSERILEIGTGLGRTCYVTYYYTKPEMFITVDISLEMLAVALYRNPINAYWKSLWEITTFIVWGDAVDVVRRLPNSFFDHIIHDGGPNPLKNPNIYTKHFFSELYRVLKPCGTLSVFAGRARRSKEMVYRNLLTAGFKIIESASLPESPALVFYALKPCGVIT